ncbi:MAG: hypothetical protein QOK36_1422 [Gaiellales bacterium]|nr:hypothetical protein [Gaiellales bacterium]
MEARPASAVASGVPSGAPRECRYPGGECARGSCRRRRSAPGPAGPAPGCRPASLTLLAELPRALRNRELILHYQPKIAVRSGELAGIEALTRWQHPTRGLIAPDQFVPAAEKTGLIEPLTRYVLDEALGQLARLDADGHRLTLAVNLSMRNLHDPTLPEQVAELLRKWSLTGDRHMHSDADDAAIVRSITTLGHDLGLEVVAEGVESRVIYDQLAGLGCDAIQGYWLSRPLPPDELREWLADAGGRRQDAAA